MRPDRRLHPAGIAVLAVDDLRDVAVPLFSVVLLVGLGGGFDSGGLMNAFALALAGVLLSSIAGYVRWLTTKWWVADDGGIHFRSGLIWTKATGIPLSRVQSLDVERGPVQRLFGVHMLHVQTGGGGKRGEIVLGAVDAEAVEALRALLAERGQFVAVTGSPAHDGEHGTVKLDEDLSGSDEEALASTAPAGVAEQPAVERHLTNSDLLRAALTAGQLGLLLSVLAVLGQFAENLINPELGDLSNRAAADPKRDAILGLLPGSVAGWVATVTIFVLVAWLLSMLGTIVAFAGFTVRRDGDRLRIRRGFVVHREATVPIERIRAVEMVEGVLRRPFGLASLRIEVIGHAAEPSAAQTLFPLLGRVEVHPFLVSLLPELADEPNGLEPVPRRALRHYVVPPALAGLAVAIAGWALAGTGAWGLFVVIPAIAYGAARYRAAGWRLNGDQLAVRSLRLARTTVFAPAVNRESHSIAQTVLQRRGNLADLAVDFGKSTRAKIRHLDAKEAATAFAAIDASRR